MATPIGNLADLTFRALDTIRSCRHVFAEDTRVSQRLLAHHAIARPLRALHQHSGPEAIERVIALVRAGDDVAYLTDAGTPGVSDPGAELSRRCLEDGLRVVPVPGASAAAAAVSVAGLVASAWLFVGFLPSRAGARRAACAELAAHRCALVVYEAPHRVEETVVDLAAALGADRPLVVCRELTKLHEEVVRMRLGDAASWLAASPDRIRGEFVLVIDAPPRGDTGNVAPAELRRIVGALAAELPPAQAARIAARITGASRDDAYREALASGASGRRRD